MNQNLDYQDLPDAESTRRYFAKFERIIGHLEQVAQTALTEDLLSKSESEIVTNYLGKLSNAFTALSYNYLMAGRVSYLLPNTMTIDRHESGFPVFTELLQMANDALQANKHLETLPTPNKLKRDMVREILNEHRIPNRLQFAMSQRLYYEYLAKGDIFWVRNDPQGSWIGNTKNKRRRYLVHWAIYDSQINIPNIYVMELEDTGRTPLLNDEKRWPRVQAELIAQSVSTLKLVTIAQGFDKDFDDLHPKSLRRFHIGPMYSNALTKQEGPLREVLAEARGKPGLDWALAWTVETLTSERVEHEKDGFFGTVERQIYKLDHFATDEQSTGASEVRQSLILPQQPYQILEERDPAGLRDVRKYVVGRNNQLLSYR